MAELAPVTVAAPLDAGLLERDEALAVLEEALAASREGCGRLVFVSGDAGIGKSALVREFCRRAGARLLWGACDGLHTPRPLGPFVDMGAAFAANKPHLVLTALLDELQAADDTIVVLEDLHWADEATLDVLGLLGRRVGQLRVVVVATYRSDELARTHPLRIVLGDLTSAPAVQRVRLAPLSVDAVAGLAEPYGVDGADLYAKTAGNPFFVTEALASGSLAIPPTVRDAVLARVTRLGEKARELLDAAAVVPHRTELWLLEALAGDRIVALDECLASGILQAEWQIVAFRHELARLVVEESIDPHRRSTLHRAALAALRDPPTGSRDLARLAHHAEAAGDGAAVLELAPAAGEQAAELGAHREAAAQFGRALRFARSLPATERAALLERRSYECYLTDQQADAIGALEEAVECYRAIGDVTNEGLGFCSLSFRRWCAGDTDGAERAATEAVALLSQLPPGVELARAYAVASSLAMNLEKAEPALALGKQAVELAEAVGDQRALVAALNHTGTTALLVGRTDEGLRDLERSIALAKAAGLEADVGRGYIHLGWAASRTRNWQLIDRLGEGIEYCSERGLELWRLYLVANRARAELDQGRWTEAAESASYVLRQPSQAPLLRVLVLTVLAVVRARRGDPDPWSPMEEARAISAGKADLQHLASVALAGAELAWLAGRTDEVAEATESVLALANERGAAWIVGELAFWRWRAGIDKACPQGAAEPFALHLSGNAASAAKEWARLGCPYEAALALADTDEDQPMRRSLEQLHALGARPAAESVARRLRERGAGGIARGPRASTRSNPAGLTDRELDVLALVADGLQNAEIADRLFLSRRTVDHHVSAILRKLGARTRGQATAEANRLGLTSAT